MVLFPGPLTILILGLAMIVAAGGFDSPSLYVPGIALAGLAVGLSLWVELAARVVGVEREEGPPRLVEGEPYPLRITIRSRWFPGPGGRVDDPLLAEPLPLRPSSRTISAAPAVWGRGRRRLPPPTVILEDPLGMRSRRVRGTTAHELLVLPLIAPVEATDSGGGRGDAAQSGLDPAGAGSRLDVAGVEFEIDGLRPYRDGSPATRIHWPTVARSGEMFERRLVAGAVGAPLVVLDAGRPDDEESLEHAVRAAASLCVHLGRRRGCAALIPGAARPVELGRDLAGWPHLHASLALVGAGDAPGGSLRSLRAQTVFWVSAASASAAERDSRRIGARRRWLVTPTGLNGIGVAFTVAGCRGQLLSAAMPREAGAGKAA